MVGEADEYTKRLLDLYDGKSNDFRRYFALLVGISLFLLFFVLLPFVSTQDVQHKVLLNITRTIQDISSTNASIGPYQSAKTGIILLHSNILKGPQSLRNYIDGLNNTQGSVQGNEMIFNECKNIDAAANRTAWLQCNVLARV